MTDVGPRVHYCQCSAGHRLEDVAQSRAGLKQWWVLTYMSGTAPALKYLVGGRQKQMVVWRGERCTHC